QGDRGGGVRAAPAGRAVAAGQDRPRLPLAAAHPAAPGVHAAAVRGGPGSAAPGAERVAGPEDARHGGRGAPAAEGGDLRGRAGQGADHGGNEAMKSKLGALAALTLWLALPAAGVARVVEKIAAVVGDEI